MSSTRQASFMILIFLIGLVSTMPALAEEEKLKLNLSELAKSAEFIKKYKALVDNPEALKTMMRLAESLKKNKETDN